MSYGDLVVCVNAAAHHVPGEPVPLVAGEAYRVWAAYEFACPFGPDNAVLDVGIDFAWCQTRFRLLPRPHIENGSVASWFRKKPKRFATSRSRKNT